MVVKIVRQSFTVSFLDLNKQQQRISTDFSKLRIDFIPFCFGRFSENEPTNEEFYRRIDEEFDATQ